MYNTCSFSSYNNNKEIDSLSFKSKHSYLITFYGDFENSNKEKPTKFSKKKGKEKLYDAATLSYTINHLDNIMMNITNYRLLERITSITDTDL